MKILLDACTFVWANQEPERLSKAATARFLDPSNELFLSVASVWEIVRKHALGRLKLTRDPEDFIREGRELNAIASLALSEDDAILQRGLPDFHKDPFDRMLVCQAILGGMTILTPDPLVRRYPVKTAW
ncbi:MAG: type II toxin-antitoxin system VapC family toxin [Candidatus Sericytochromatia bacterium]|uniref:Type II toxin-antitoxin system VapC family toxin n=1 Tax=Candidatus Tanganyikabacteria bacterium TaxID=2961651 RepID=A0A938BJ07_9BACT|nr:type II toxin-antitoxin system VapC family toxin [Candidatus Tanganyikabacteria bacterium]